jgi:hypothetical protein
VIGANVIGDELYKTKAAIPFQRSACIADWHAQFKKLPIVCVAICHPVEIMP